MWGGGSRTGVDRTDRRERVEECLLGVGSKGGRDERQTVDGETRWSRRVGGGGTRTDERRFGTPRRGTGLE